MAKISDIAKNPGEVVIVVFVVWGAVFDPELVVWLDVDWLDVDWLDVDWFTWVEVEAVVGEIVIVEEDADVVGTIVVVVSHISLTTGSLDRIAYYLDY